MTTTLTHYHLSAEAVDDENGPAILLTQQDGPTPQTLLAHPWQLRAVCEQFGIIASDPKAAKTIATLQRRMVALADRIKGLAAWMAKHSDHKHADLTYEMTTINALADLAGEWVADFDEPGQQAMPPCSSTTPTPAQATLL